MLENKRLFCQCDYIKLHSSIRNENFYKQLNEANIWISTKRVKELVKMRNIFDDVFRNNFKTLFPVVKQISLCKYHRIEYLHAEKNYFQKYRFLDKNISSI